MSEHDVLVVGGGHNGLICACYLACAGLRVLVLEMADHVGGAVHTAATIPTQPAYHLDTCSVIDNQIETTTFPAGGVLGVPGRLAARAVLADLARPSG